MFVRNWILHVWIKHMDYNYVINSEIIKKIDTHNFKFMGNVFSEDDYKDRIYECNKCKSRLLCYKTMHGTFDIFLNEGSRNIFNSGLNCKQIIMKKACL